jgi:hypothetical protein
VRPSERELVAVHEASHLWVSWLLGSEPEGAQIFDSGGGYCFMGKELGPALEVCVLLAGRVGEELRRDRGRDLEPRWLRAALELELARHPDDARAELLSMDDSVLVSAAQLAADLLAERWGRVMRTTDELIRHGVVGAREAGLPAPT